jgi:hypothetical protein
MYLQGSEPRQQLLPVCDRVTALPSGEANKCVFIAFFELAVRRFFSSVLASLATCTAIGWILLNNPSKSSSSSSIAKEPSLSDSAKFVYRTVCTCFWFRNSEIVIQQAVSPSPEPGKTGPCVYVPPSDWVAQLYPQALGSLSVVLYVSQCYGGGRGPSKSHLTNFVNLLTLTKIASYTYCHFAKLM